jgi:hypothetical protein
MKDWDDEDSGGYWDFKEKPLLCNRKGWDYIVEETDHQNLVPKGLQMFGDKPDRDGMQFAWSTVNEDGEDAECYDKKWEVFGAYILYEKHGKLCDCSYCQEFDKRWGIVLPKCRCRNAWRIFYWRKSKWPCELSCIRFTLPSFIRWRCRRCRESRIAIAGKPKRHRI